MYNKPQGLFPILQEELKPHGEIGHIIIRVLAINFKASGWLLFNAK
jgi:hypothetical protein